MTDKQQSDALRLVALLDAEEWPGSMTIVSYARECVAELRRQYAEIETLRTGYAAARLEIESLQSQLHAAKQINAAQFNLLAASIPGSAMRQPHGQAPAPAAPAYKDSTPELHIGDSAFESWYSTYSPAHKSDKQRARDAYAAGMGDPLVTAAPAAVAGPSLYQVMAVAKAIHATTPDADDWDSLRQCEVDALRGRAEKVLAALAAAPTSQPAPQQEVQANTKTHDLLGTMIGLFLGAKDKIGYKPGSVVDKVVAEAVEHLKDWPYPEPAPKRDRSQTAVQLAELVLSDCGHSSNYTPLLERVAARIDAHVERILGDAPVPAAVAGPVVNRATVIECLDANDIEVTDRQMDGLFHSAAPAAQGDALDAVDVPDQCPYFGPSPHRDVWLDGWYAACATKPAPPQEAQEDAQDAARLDWLENDVGCRVFHLGKSWYTSANFGMPYRKRASLRAAIDAASAAQEGKL